MTKLYKIFLNNIHLLYSYLIIFGIVVSVFVGIVWMITPRSNTVSINYSYDESKNDNILINSEDVFDITINSPIKKIDNLGVFVGKVHKDDDATIKATLIDNDSHVEYSNEYKYNDLSELSYLAVFPNNMISCQGHSLTLRVELKNIDNSSFFIYRAKKSNDSTASINGKTIKNSMAYSINGKKPTLAYEWYPITFLIILIILASINDWKKFKEENLWVRRKK